MATTLRRRAVIAAGLGLLGLGAVLSWVLRPSSEGPGDLPPPALAPDLLLVVVDTLRADHLGTYGHDLATSPALDAFAARGVVFERAYAHSGWTLPSMASLLTGLYPFEHAVVRDASEHRSFGSLDEDVETLAERLGARGYRTGAFVNNTFLAPHFGLNQGFDEYDYAGATNAEHRSAAQTVRAAVEWLGAADPDTPSFALIHFIEPHVDYAPSERSLAALGGAGGAVPPPVTAPVVSQLSDANGGVPTEEQRRAIGRIYDAEILDVDAALGELFAAVDARSRPRWVWVTSDHGEELWDHGGFEHGHALSGVLVRVPLVVVGEGLAPGRVAAPVQHLDVFRTLVRLGGGEVPPPGRGLDLRRVVIDPDVAPEDRPILHEDALYGPWRAALTRGRHRAVVELPNRRASLYRLDERGQGDALVEAEADRDPLLWPMLEELFELRGGQEVPRIRPERTSRIGNTELEQLRALGYVR